MDGRVLMMRALVLIVAGLILAAITLIVLGARYTDMFNRALNP